ncbi:hypothetical protein [Dialister succinatiphilus]|uniref:hypothetical protein n=1 Tax=Dialister succinatiphilus TaxID=487173 RepID=UPI0040293B50
MAKNGMRRQVYYRSDPTFEAVLARWRQEERAMERSDKSISPIRVLGTVRMLIKRAGYRLISDIEILDTRTGDKYRSITERKGKK